MKIRASRRFFLLFFLLTLSFCLTSAVPTPVRAQTGEGVLGWETPAGLWVPPEYFPDPMSACRRQWEIYHWWPENRFEGYKDTGNWLRKECDWVTPTEGGPATILPGAVKFRCANGYTPIFPGSCMRDTKEDRPPCSAGGGSPTPIGGTNPILLTTGAKYEQEEDFATADGRLKLIRQYRSLRTGNAAWYNMDSPGLGWNWRFSFDYELHLASPFGSWQTLTLHVPDGASYDFSRKSDGTLTPTDDDAQQVAMSVAFVGPWPTDLNTLTNSASRWVVTLPDNRVVTLATFRPYGSSEFTVGRPIAITDRDGYSQTFRYDARGALQTVTDNLGRALTFTWIIQDPSLYGATNAPRPLAVQRIGFPDGTAVRYGYDMASAAPEIAQPLPERLTRVEHFNASGAVVSRKTYHYEDPRFRWALTGMTDERGVRVATWTYDGQGRALSSEHAGGVDRYTIAYADTDTIAIRTVTNPLGKKTTYNFTRSNQVLRLANVTGAPSPNCVGSTRGITYDAQGFIRTTTDEEGRVTQYTYNSRGLPTRIIESAATPQARTTDTVWHPTWRLPTQITEATLLTTFTYDANGRLTQLQQQDRGSTALRVWSYQYTTRGLLAAVNGPLPGTGDQITYAYNAQGYLQTVTNGLGHVTTVTAVNGRGQPTRILDPSGVQTALSYDARGRLLSVTTDVTGVPEVSLFTYDAAGQVTKITRPDGSYLLYSYDGAKRLKQVANTLGENIAYAYDAMGNMTQRVVRDNAAAVVGVHRQTFDELGRLLRSIGAVNQTWRYAYDKVDNLVSITDPRNGVFSNAYDGLNQLIRETDEEQVPVTLTRTARGEVATHQDGRQVVTRFTRNGWGEVIREESPDAGVTTYVRNAPGQVIQQTDGRGVITQYRYDGAGRLTAKLFPAAPPENVTYAYDDVTVGNFGKGRLTRITDASAGSTAYRYDAKGRIVKETRTIAGRVYPVLYAYTKGRLSSLTYPSGRIVTYARNADGKVRLIATQPPGGGSSTTLASAIRWQPFGALAGLTYGNGLAETRSYDKDDRLLALKVMNGAAAILDKGYGYADGVNLTVIQDRLNPLKTERFTYSPTQRLSDASGAWGSLSVDYDGVGNRTATTTILAGGAATTERYLTAVDSNQLDSMVGGAGRVFVYDGAGNVITDKKGTALKTYAYNKAGRLASITVGGARKGTYLYNALEQLVARTTTATVHYIHDQDGHIIAEANGSGSPLREYIWLEDKPLTVYAYSGTALPAPWYVQSDHLDRPVMMTNGARASVWQALWRPWGEAHSITGPASLDMRFPGQWFQIESGLHYNWHRHYDPTTGRYVQPDPIRFDGGDANLYGYAMNNPLTFVDQDGKNPVSLGIVGGILVVGACSESADRNQYNKCPEKEPRNDSCYENNWDKDWEWYSDKFKSPGSRSYRGEDGSECTYDENGNLLPDVGTYNFGPGKHSSGHFVKDILPHWICRLLGFDYTSGLTTSY